MRRSVLLALCCLLASASFVRAQSGETGLSFLKIGVGSRALSMGEAAVAAANDPSAIYYNPAALSASSTSKILLMHREWVQGSRTDFLGASTMVGSLHLGLGVTSAAIDDIEVRAAPGPAISTFTSRNASVSLGGAYDVSTEVSIGVAGKFLYEKIFLDEASGFAVDLGGVYRAGSSLTVGASVSNLGSMNELRDESSKLPTILRFGGAYAAALDAFESIVTGSADVVSMSAEGRTHLHIGAEAEFKRTFLLRAGIQTGYEAKSFSAGVGVRQGMFQFDYAFIPFSLDLGATHTLAVLISFP